jgi:DNA-binding Lrp family transcriptional regulator
MAVRSVTGVPPALDRADRRLLRQLQQDASLPLVELAE